VIPVEYYIFGSIFGGLLNPSRRDAGLFQILLWSNTDSSPGNFGIFVVREGSLKGGTRVLVQSIYGMREGLTDLRYVKVQ
jgi:hypothetical protein